VPIFTELPSGEVDAIAFDLDHDNIVLEVDDAEIPDSTDEDQ